MLQKATRHAEGIATDVSMLSTTTQTLHEDNRVLREQFQAQANALGGDLTEVKLRLDKVNQINDTTMARFKGMEEDIADIHEMAAILPQEIQSIITQTVSQTVATAFATLQQNPNLPPPRGRILHHKVVPAKLRTLKSTPQGLEDSEPGKRWQVNLASRTYPYAVEQSQKMVLWKGTLLSYKVTVVLRKIRRLRVYESYETNNNEIEVDVYAQSKGWPLAGRMHAKLRFGQSGGCSAFSQAVLTPSRFLCEEDPLIQASRWATSRRFEMVLSTTTYGFQILS